MGIDSIFKPNQLTESEYQSPRKPVKLNDAIGTQQAALGRQRELEWLFRQAWQPFNSWTEDFLRSPEQTTPAPEPGPATSQQVPSLV